jgi:chromosomal replication initiator protein
MNAPGAEIWKAVSSAFGSLRGERARALWLADARAGELRRGLFTLDVPSAAAKAAIDARYRSDLEALFLQLTGSHVRVLTRLAEEAAPAAPPPRAPPAADAEPPLRAAAFVPTTSNRLALRALERFVLAPESGWNPLFVHGPAGCGKTELASEALRRLRDGGTAADPLVLSGPALSADVSRAARAGTLPGLRAGWLGRDVLVLDEAHRLRGRRRSQTEACALIEDAVHAGRRVLVLSRHAPRALALTDPRLLSWYQSGMIVALAEPDSADREAILSAAAAQIGVEVEPEVVSALARRCPGTLADAMALLQRAVQEAQERGEPLGLAALDRRLAQPTPAERSLRAVVDTVGRHLGVSPERIGSAEKTRTVAAARHLCAYLATHSLGLPTRQVCRSLGSASPSLVAYARRAVEQRRVREPEFDRLVHELQARLQGAQRDFPW